MEAPIATTFDQYVAIIATTSPTAIVLDCWRRLDLTLGDYGRLLPGQVNAQNRSAIEAAVAQDEALGQDVAASLHSLRELRNRVAHETSVQLSAEAATDFARHSFAVLGVLSKRVAELEGAA